MLQWFANLPVRKRVGILAVILGIIAVFLGDPYDRAKIKINLSEIALTSSEDMAKIEVKELTDWIIKGKADYRLIDLRSGEKYSEYNIPTSENILPTHILDSDLLRNEKIILYSDDDITAAKVWFILKAQNYKAVYLLKGGLNAWRNEILFPSLPSDATPKEKMEYKKIAEVSKFFGGRPRSGINVNTTEINLPKLKAPKKIIVKRTRGKKKREGC